MLTLMGTAAAWKVRSATIEHAMELKLRYRVKIAESLADVFAGCLLATSGY